MQSKLLIPYNRNTTYEVIDDYFVYLHNRIVLMVPEGNPAGIKSVLDLAKDEIRISQPNPENEDIAKYIIEMYSKAGDS